MSGRGIRVTNSVPKWKQTPVQVFSAWRLLALLWLLSATSALPATAAPPAYAGLFTQQSGGYYLWSGVDWNSFVAKWQELGSQNLRLISIDTQVDANGTTLFSGTWIQGSAGYALYRTTDLNFFLNQFNQLAQSGLRLTDIHIDSSGGQRYYTGVWLGGGSSQVLVQGVDWNTIISQWESLGQQGYRLIRLLAYPHYNSVRYIGVFEQGSGAYGLWVTSDWNEFLTKYNEWTWMQLVDFRVFDNEGTRQYLGVWRETNLMHSFVYGQDWNSFVNTWNTLSNNGQLLRTIREYPTSRETINPNWAGVFQNALGSSAQGYAWIVSRNGQTVSSGVSGRVRSPYESANANTFWTLDRRINLASVSKPITAVGIIKLLNDRGISLDAPFYPYIQGKVPTVGQGVNTVTFRQLLSMRSGLQPNGTVYTHQSFWDFLRQYLQQGLTGTPGQTFAYSNTNFSILQGALEEISGLPYDRYIKEQVLAPMSIDTSRFTTDPDPSSWATLSYSGQQDQRFGYYWPKASMLGPSGWIAPASELIKFLTGVRNHVVLSPQKTEEMFTQQLGWFIYEGAYGQYFNFEGRLINGMSPQQGLSTVAIRFSDGYDALLLVNTPVSNLTDVMVKAFQTQQ